MSVKTKFSDMPIGERNRWIAWANSHDWAACRDPRYDSATGEMVTASQETADGEIWETVEARHKTPDQMRAWAGY